MAKERVCKILTPGSMAFEPACELQRRLVERVREDRSLAFLILLEHEPVITIGRRGSERNILTPAAVLQREGVHVAEVDRGGDVTYHGPGQIVGYPIFALDDERRDVHKYLRALEALLIRTMARFGIHAARKNGYTGVWVGPEKLASIGVGFRQWICFHGFALNVDPNLAHFDLIHPCGLRGVRMTSMSRLLGRPVEVAEVHPHLVDEFAREFGFERMEPMSEDGPTAPAD